MFKKECVVMENNFMQTMFYKFKISLLIVLTCKPSFISDWLLNVLKLYDLKNQMDEYVFQKYYKKVGRLSQFYIVIGIVLGVTYGLSNQIKIEDILLVTIVLFTFFFICSILFLMNVLPSNKKFK